MYGYVGLCTVMYGYVWLCRATDALVDSLFRLVILALFGLSKQEFSVFKIKIQ